MKVAFITGAGISAPSGIPVYRGEGGIWTLDPDAEARSNSKEYEKNPLTVESHLEEIKELCAASKPNTAHRAINELAQRHEVTVITQNVDGFHYSSMLIDDDGKIIDQIRPKIIELHGNVFRKQCLDCKEKTYLSVKTCPYCNSVRLRYDVVLFGDDIDDHSWLTALRAVHAAEMNIVVGTTGSVFPCAHLIGLANDLAYTSGVPLHYFNLEKNHENYPFAKFHYGDCATTLPEFLNTL